MEVRSDLEQLLEDVTREYRTVVGDLLFAYEERVLNCHVTDDDNRDHVLYNEQDLTLDLYTIVEEYTDKMVSALTLIMEEKIEEVHESLRDPLRCNEE